MTKISKHGLQKIVRQTRQANYDNTMSNFTTAAWVGFTLVCCVLLPIDKVPKDTFIICKVLENLSCQCRKSAKESNDRLDKTLEELDE